MRTISAASLAKLAQNLGTEPVNIVEVQWVAEGQRFSYGDKDTGTIKGKILELGGLDSIIQISGGSDSNQLSLVLDDVDSEIKNLVDAHDVNKRSVWVYQWFQGLALSEKFLIFRGEISSPLVWDEGDRTVSFTVISKIEDNEVGFSIEEGNFPQPPDELIGKAWPLVFGTVCDVPALQATSPRQGILKSGIGIHDFTLENRICQAKYLICPTERKGTYIPISTPRAPTGGIFLPGDTGEIGVPVYGANEDCARSTCEKINELELSLTEQLTFEYDTLTVIGGEKFPQGEIITLDINGAKFTGTFSGEVFSILSRKHPDFDTTTLIPCRQISGTSFTQAPTWSFGWARQEGGNSWNPPWDITGILTACEPSVENQGPVSDGGAAASQKALDDMPTSNFFWAPSGSRVTMDGEEEILYIANLIPSSINRVSAFRRLATGEKLMTLPDTMYDIFQTDYGGYMVMELLFNKLPSLTPNPVNGKVDGKWGDDVYVSQTSSVGPNTVDILQWLIETYTEFDVDITSFDDVRALIDNYPSNFAILDRRNVVDVLKEIAEQARCAIFVRDNTVFIKYLSEEPDSVATIEESHIIANSLSIEHTDTEDLVTKYTANWKKSGAQEDDYKIILRHNIKKYGTQEDEVDYYIYNIQENVLKSATFWLIRKSNTWRRVNFKTTIKHLALEVFDCITLNLSDVAPAPIKAIIEKATFNSSDNTISFECWTPLKAGTPMPYIFAWPAGTGATEPFPTSEEIEAGYAGSGGGGGYVMVPPDGHLLSHQTEPVDTRADWGDRFPSDLGDEFIAVDCPSGTDVDLEDEDAPILNAFNRAASAGYQTATNAENEGAGSGGSNQSKKSDGSGVCGGAATDSESCRYSVKVTYATVVSVRDPVTLEVLTSPGDSGTLVNATSNIEMCHVFGSAYSARLYRDQQLAEAVANADDTFVGANIVFNAILGTSSGGAHCAAIESAQGDNPNPETDQVVAQDVKTLNEAAATATGSPVNEQVAIDSALGQGIINQYAL